MSRTVISGGHIITPLEERISTLTIEGGLISAIGARPANLPECREIDATGCFVTPGLFDLQVNGGPPCDFWDDPTPAQIVELARQLASVGVTTILPTLITDDLTHLRKNIDFLTSEIGVQAGELQADKRQTAPAGRGSGSQSSPATERMLRMPGIHLEGPCLSPERPGVHPKQHLAPLSVAVLQKIITPSVRLMTLAPELDPSGDALSYLQEHNVVAALGHSNATFEEAQAAFQRGIRLMTHTFNALPPIHHRAPGAVTAALLDERVSCCIICDGLHLAPAAVKLVVAMKKAAKIILVTDIAHVGTSQGGLVGSSITLDQAVRNVVEWGVLSFSDAILSASYNPARVLGFDDRIGHLAPGKCADVLVWQKDSLKLKHVISRGELLF